MPAASRAVTHGPRSISIPTNTRPAARIPVPGSRQRRRGDRRSARVTGSARPSPRAAGPAPTASPRSREVPRRGRPRPSQHPRRGSHCLPRRCVHYGWQRGADHRDLMVKCSPMSRNTSRRAGARSDTRTRSPGQEVADLLAATSAETGTTRTRQNPEAGSRASPPIPLTSRNPGRTPDGAGAPRMWPVTPSGHDGGRPTSPRGPGWTRSPGRQAHCRNQTGCPTASPSRPTVTRGTVASTSPAP